MHIIIALLCFAILLSISPTARWFFGTIIFLGIVAYALQCNEGGKVVPITTTAQAAFSDASDASNERTKACQTQSAKGLACLNMDLPPSSPETRHAPLKAPVAVEHLSQPRAVATPIGFSGPFFVDHNGSVMQVLQSTNGSVDIVYAYPRQGLWGLVAPGTLYVHGQWVENILYATAYVFSHACGPTPYQVSGGVEPNGILILNGPAPLVDPQTCQILQWIWSDNSTVMFMPFNRR